MKQNILVLQKCVYMSLVMVGGERKARGENARTEQLGKGPTGKLARTKS